MQVVEYLKRKLKDGHSSEEALTSLTEELAIKTKVYPEEGLVVLNYNQIESPKTHPIVMECRGLILSLDNFEVVSRSFDRFFNLGEAPDTCKDFDITRSTVFEKADGSLTKVYHWDGAWHISTRGTAFAETENYIGKLFRDMALEAFDTECVDLPDNFNDFTYIFELTSPDNRVVTRYDEPEMVLLGARNNGTGHYTQELQVVSKVLQVCGLRNRPAKTFSLSTESEVVEASKSLPNLQEGYVCYDPVSGKRVKVKSPAYLAVHKLRGDSLPTPKRIVALVLTKEEEEYLAYFPEDRKLFSPYIVGLGELEKCISTAWEETKGEDDQKAFALNIKHLPFSSCLFKARQNGSSPVHEFHAAKDSFKSKVLFNFMGETGA